MPRIRIKVIKPSGFAPKRAHVPMGKVAHVRSNLSEGAPIKHSYVRRGDVIGHGAQKKLSVVSNKNSLITGQKRDQYSKTTVRIGKSENKKLTFHGTAPIHVAGGGGPGAMGPRNSKTYAAQMQKKKKAVSSNHNRVWNGRGYS